MPDRSGKFQVLAEIGRAEMGIVYKVKDKVGAARRAEDDPAEALVRPDSALRFKREFARCSASSTRTSSACSSGTARELSFFTMELVEGKGHPPLPDGDEPIVPAERYAARGTLSEQQRRLS